MKILLFLLFCINPDEIQIKNKELNQNILLDLNKLIIFKKDSLTTINLDTGLSKSEFVSNRKIDLSNFTFRKINDDLYLFQKSGGLVYKVIGNKISRIDYSYEHRLQNKSLEFQYKNKVYRFGGYGFFDRSSILTFFDIENNEWELFYNYKKTLKNGINDFTFGFVDKEILYTFGGLITDEDGKSQKFTRNSYSINLNNYEIDLLGKLPQDFPKKFINYIKSKNKIYLLKDKNTLYVYDIPTKSYSIIYVKSKIDKLIGTYNNNLYYFTSLTNYPDKILIKHLKIDQLKLSNSIQIFDDFNYLMIIPFVSMVFLLGFYRDLTKEKTLLKIKDGLLYDQKNKQIFLEKKQLDLVLYLIKERMLNNPKLLEYMGNDKFDIGHQNRVKNKLINGINQIIYSRVNEKLILIKTDRMDKRSKFYFINKRLL